MDERHWFRRRWDEPRGDDHDAWGCSTWWFETDPSGSVLRQIEVYDSGPTLRYDNDQPADEFGSLSAVDLDLDEFESYLVEQVLFERAWLQES